MQLEFPLRKLILEWRYAPNLKIYRMMDSLGGDLHDQFPDWERSALTLEIRDKKRHRRIFYSHARSFFEADFERIDQEDYTRQVEVGKDALGKVAHSLEFTELQRLGMRHWFAMADDRSFPALVDVIRERFYANGFDGVHDATIADVSYQTSFEHSKGWGLNLRIGPMERLQWFQEAVPYERGIYERTIEVDAFRKMVESFPKQFIFVDIDYSKSNARVADAPGILIEMREHCKSTLNNIVSYCGEKKK